MSFRRAGFVLALVVAIAGVLAPASAAPVRAAAPGLTIVGDTRYVVDPDNAARPRDRSARRGQPPQGHEDPPLLLRPRVPRGPPEHERTSRSRLRPCTPTVQVASAKGDHTLLRIDFGKRLPAGSTRGMT